MTSPAGNPLTYNSYVATVAALAIINAGQDLYFSGLIPQMLNYAELRIQRDLDLLPLQTENDTYALTIGSNLLPIAVNDFVTVQNVAVVSGTKRIQLIPTSKEVIQFVYGDSSVTATPAYFAPYGGDALTNGATSLNFIVGPYPDLAYPLAIVGTMHAQSLYTFYNTPLAATATTFISANLPDLLVMASMIFISQYQRNFAASSNSPEMAGSYENQYQTLLKSVAGEQLRKRFRASAWSSEASSPAATPART
jgi:hypothetical protein